MLTYSWRMNCSGYYEISNRRIVGYVGHEKAGCTFE